jgi:Ubiquitin family
VARALFEIPTNRDISITVKHEATDLKPSEIDPTVWPIIKDEIADVWIQTLPLTSANKSQDDDVSYILITTVGNGNIILIVKDNDTIAQIKQKLRETGFTLHRNERLFYKDQELEDGETLRHYSIPMKSSLQLRWVSTGYEVAVSGAARTYPAGSGV